jgi:4-hydroxy-2-oxoheptanedioate aldolase
MGEEVRCRSAVLRERWAAGGPSFGAWCAIDSPLAVELVALGGFDWLCIDLQHGAAGLESAASLLQAASAAGAAPLIRVPANEPWLIGRALDLGAAGVIVPMVGGPEEASRALGAARYPPAGSRSVGRVRTDGGDDDPLCVAMCETRAGVERLRETCAVPGVDGVYIGPGDLALSHGFEAGDELETVIAGILETCRRSGIPAGIQARSGADAAARAEAGFSFASVASDRDLLARGAAAELATALGAAAPPLAAPPPGVLHAVARYT